MELKILTPNEQFLSAIKWNFEEIKAEVASKMEEYKNVVYSDEQIKLAKEDKAKLNKFVTALEDKRKELKKQCLAPYEAFEKEMKQVTSLVNEPITLIDKQIKEYDEKKKQEKSNEIKELFATIGFPDFVGIESIWDNKWLNVTVSMKSIQEAMEQEKAKIDGNLKLIEALPEYSFEALAYYKKTLNIVDALQKAKEMTEIAKAKEEAKKKEAEQIQGQASFNDAESFAKAMNIPFAPDKEEKQVEEPKNWIAFEAYLSTSDAIALKQFFKSRNISFRAV